MSLPCGQPPPQPDTLTQYSKKFVVPIPFLLAPHDFSVQCGHARFLDVNDWRTRPWLKPIDQAG
jgi:hypothetical protein